MKAKEEFVMKQNFISTLLFLLLVIGAALMFYVPQSTKLSPFLYPLGIIVAGLACCIWNWRKEPEFTGGFLMSAGGVILGVLIAILFLFLF